LGNLAPVFGTGLWEEPHLPAVLDDLKPIAVELRLMNPILTLRWTGDLGWDAGRDKYGTHWHSENIGRRCVALKSQRRSDLGPMFFSLERLYLAVGSVVWDQ
jgi:hypothetical protein